MSPAETALLLLVGGLLAGGLGALTGLGGGVVLVPVLTLLFGVPLREAVGVSLLSVIATSAGAALRFHGTGLVHARAGSLLQAAACAGALLGALVAGRLPTSFLFVLFGLVLLYSAATAVAPRSAEVGHVLKDSPAAARLGLGGSSLEGGRLVPYQVTNVGGGLAVMGLAGLLSALLGIGSGAFNVLAMERLMRYPFRVATATSSLIVGAVAATSAGVYLSRGEVPPLVAGPVALGVLAGSAAGAALASRLPVRALRIAFAAVLSLAAVRMLLRGVGA